MSSPETLFKATIYLFISFITAYLFAFFLGMVEPRITDGLIDTGIMNLAHPEWADQSNTNRMRNLLYVIPYLIAIMGIVYFLIAVVKRQKYDQFGNEITDIDMRW